MSDLNWKIKKWQEEVSKKANKKETFCDICKDKGFIMDRRIVDKNEYEYSLHCVCKSAEKWKDIMYCFDRYYTIEQLMARVL